MLFTGDEKPFNARYEQNGNSEFEILGQGHFWGLKLGCVCSGGGRLSFDDRKCKPDSYSVCADIPRTAARAQPIVNNVQLCARRDTSLTFLTRAKPEEVDGQWVCKDEGNKGYTQLCGDKTQTQYKDLVCIKPGSICPVTYLKFYKAADGT